MPDPNYVSVRRHSDEPFGVLVEDLESVKPTGYDLDMVRSLTMEGLTSPLVVLPLPGGRFRVVDGRKRLAAILLLIRSNKPIYDGLRCMMRPASRIFAILRCRIQTAAEAISLRRSVGPPVKEKIRPPT
jgi:hypothetical protein